MLPSSQRSSPIDDRSMESRGDGQSYLTNMQGEVGFPFGQTTLLVIDPVNDFLSEGGAAWDMTKNTVRLHDVVGNMRRAIDGARQRGIPVIFAPIAYTEEDYAQGKLQCRCGINRIIFEKRMFMAGSWGADFHPDLRPHDDEIVLLPHKGTDVFETDLPEHLTRLGTTHLVIAGMTANLCCESTGRRAVEKGYDVTYLSDAIGAESLLGYEAALHVNYPLLANAVMTVDEFLVALDTPRRALLDTPHGFIVRGSDHGDIGTVLEVVQPTDATDGYLLVSRGILSRDIYVPFDAVVHRAGNEVFINVPKSVVDEMPWTYAASRQQRMEKCGPPAERVGKLYGSHAPSAASRSHN